MGKGAEAVRRKKFARLRAWNRRAEQWSHRHPWRYSAIYASSFTAAQFWVHYHYDFGPGPLFHALAWLLLFAGGASATKVRAARPHREPLSTPPTDLTLRGDNGPALGEDGRRWRTGTP